MDHVVVEESDALAVARDEDNVIISPGAMDPKNWRLNGPPVSREGGSSQPPVRRMPLPPPGSDSEGRYQCTKCPRRFPTPQSLGGHMSFHVKAKRLAEALLVEAPPVDKITAPTTAPAPLAAAAIDLSIAPAPLAAAAIDLSIAPPPLAAAAIDLSIAPPPLAAAAIDLSIAPPPLAAAAIDLSIAPPPLPAAAIDLSIAPPPLAAAVIDLSIAPPPLPAAAIDLSIALAPPAAVPVVPPPAPNGVHRDFDLNVEIPWE